MNNYTSIEQSKKLVELGLNPDTADMCYLSQTPQGEPIFFERPAVQGGDTEQYYKTSLPCWSVGALLEVMPSEYELIKNSDNTYEICFSM